MDRGRRRQRLTQELHVIEGRGTVDIKRPPAAILAFVSDLEKYKRADLKIGRIYAQERDAVGADGVVVIRMRHGGTLRGLPGPPVSLVMRVDAHGPAPGARYQSDGRGVARFFLTFDGGFELARVDDGTTRVTHVERFRFHWPWRIVAEPFLRAWLQRDVEAEVLRLKELIEAEPA